MVNRLSASIFRVEKQFLLHQGNKRIGFAETEMELGKIEWHYEDILTFEFVNSF